MVKEKTDDPNILIEEAFVRAKEVLGKCSTPNGLYASPVQYNAVYARDALITSLGGLLSGEERLVEQWFKTMDTLMDRQSDLGQIPNNVDVFISSRPTLIAFGAADASLWFVLSLAYAERLLGEQTQFQQAADRALEWLKYQDSHEDLLIEQQEASDWMDIICNRGHVLYTNALYFAAIELRRDIKHAHLVKQSINRFLWNDDLGYFMPYSWKQIHGNWFDTAGNCFAVAFGLADADQTDSILRYISENRLSEPYPVRVLHPPILPGEPDWRDYYVTEHDLNRPDHYHNGGIWPWVGGLYVAALVRAGRLELAREELYNLARADKLGRESEWEFNEWIHGIDGNPMGSPDQAWSAGMYIYAYACVKEGHEPVFSVLESRESQSWHNLPPEE